MQIKVKMTPAFHAEWCASEVVSEFTRDVDAMLACEDADAWEAAGYHHIHDYEPDRIQFNACMLRAHETKSYVIVTFNDAALRSVLRPHGLQFQIDKWEGWGSEGAGYVRSAYRVLAELWDAIDGTPLADELQEQIIAQAQADAEWLRRMRDR